MEPLLQWKSGKYYIFWLGICNLKYPACNEHAPICHQWTARLYSIFPHYLITGMVFEKKTWLSIDCVFWFPVQVSYETLFILKRSGRGRSKMYIGLHVQYLLCLSDFHENWIITTDFLNIFKYYHDRFSKYIQILSRQIF